MHLLLIRHGQSCNNALAHAPGDYSGRLPDPPLTDLGREQAARLADWAFRDPFCSRITHLLTSLTTRAVQTAAPLAQTLGLNVHGVTQAYECGGLSSGPAGGFTPVPGRDHASLLLDCPALQWPQDLTGRAWDGGCEPWADAHFTARAAAVLAHLQATDGDADVMALITHQDFAQYLLAHVLGLPAQQSALTFQFNNTATAHIEVRATAGGPTYRTVH
ncbi:histidine phosphatase family protein (plasmid) [Deinococcus taeanensis]|uniref:histidine phosphatase family protein n=1 Tax=Deinococcus taeanensis TaxID=2737050 RepID=UPI001CDC58A9|nr:histidine phosphatase family protein [Deinococcus taeanensis]UBV45088.1 histidine phosphatase family protein [Deinococcus taeanensis]